jgi:hypothetical protein
MQRVDLTKAKNHLEWRKRGVARRVKQAVDKPIQARRGRRFGQTLASQPPLATDTRAAGKLESYFDAHTEGPGLWKWRHYFPIYERHLGKFVGRAPRIVEIGVFSGGSLLMWRDYFGDGTHVHGVDIEPACKAYAGPGISITIGDQSEPEFWKRFLADNPQFDVVIDDGGHEAVQQIPTLEALLPNLTPGGVYLCEDIHGPDHAFHAYIDGLSRNLNDVGPRASGGGQEPSAFQEAIASVHLYPFVAVIEKRDARLERLIAPKHGTQWEPFYGDPHAFPSSS